MSKTAAIIGSGVIGGGWAARFVLAGWHVRVFDPAPNANAQLNRLIANARASLPGLYDTPLPPAGRLSVHETLADAVSDADWIQESVPERLELKHETYRAIQTLSAPGVTLASSTSGFTPSELQQGALRPDEIIVAHPFNPVYLIPLVEMVTTPDQTDRAASTAKVLRGLGMSPLGIDAEIPGHVADRLLEAVWREALWLVNDGVATTAQIDDAIRLGFGLRWAQMGLFETYRIAGGPGGMAHFLDQFGPALSLPWTKLMEVPELTPDLIARIAEQSDAQSGHLSLEALEAQRDANLVGILRALKAERWGAGAALAASDAARMPAPGAESAPLLTSARTVPMDWADYNGHMTEARYLHAFGNATDRFMELLGVDADYLASGGSFFTAETHIRHLAELRIGATLEIRTTCLSGEGKRMHLWHEMRSEGQLVATGEHMLIHVSLESRRPAPPTSPVSENLARIARTHARLARAKGLGRAIGDPR